MCISISMKMWKRAGFGFPLNSVIRRNEVDTHPTPDLCVSWFLSLRMTDAWTPWSPHNDTFNSLKTLKSLACLLKEDHHLCSFQYIPCELTCRSLHLAISSELPACRIQCLPWPCWIIPRANYVFQIPIALCYNFRGRSKPPMDNVNYSS